MIEVMGIRVGMTLGEFHRTQSEAPSLCAAAARPLATAGARALLAWDALGRVLQSLGVLSVRGSGRACRTKADEKGRMWRGRSICSLALPHTPAGQFDGPQRPAQAAAAPSH